MRQLYFATVLPLSLAACGSSEPLALDYEPREIAKVPIEIFRNAERVDCSSEGPTRLAMVYLGGAGMNPDTEVLRSAVQRAQFADGRGYIGGVELRWRPGDPGKRLKRIDYFIFDEDCRVQVWRAGKEHPA